MGLVLQRKRNESIAIDGGRIVVTVVEFRGGPAVRLAIEAPPEVRVDRWEVHEARQAEEGRQDGPKEGR